jgi:hypothetical protein
MIVLRGFSQWFAPHRREAFTQCAKGRPGEIRSKMHVNNTTHTSKPRGQSLVEFALLLPVLLLLILGAMDFGRLFYTKLVLTNAAREGANYLARHPADEKEIDDKDNPENNKERWEETRNVIENEAANSSIITVIVDCSDNNCPIDCNPIDEDGCAQYGMATVTARASVDLIFGGFLETVGLTSGPITLSSTVRMLVQ